MYYTNHLIKYFTLAILIASSISCTQLPEGEASTETSENTTTREALSSKDLNHYKESLYALRDNKTKKAEILLNDIIDKHPNLAGPHANISLIYYQNGKIEQAKESLKKTIALNPKNPYAYNILGIIETKKGGFSKAEKYFLLALEHKTDYAKAHYNIALLYDIYFHEIKKSVHHYQKYLTIIDKKGIKDKQTSDWVEQLKNSLKQG